MIKENIEVTKRKIEKIRKQGIDEHQRKKYKELVNLIIKFKENKNSSILDVGCRSGHLFDEFFIKDYKNCYGIDISPDAINYLKERGYFGQILNIQEEKLENKFDIIIACHIIEHTNNPIKTIINLFTMLNEFGILYIEVPKENKLNEKEAHFSHFLNLNDLKNLIRQDNFIYENDIGSLKLIYQKGEKSVF